MRLACARLALNRISIKIVNISVIAMRLVGRIYVNYEQELLSNNQASNKLDTNLKCHSTVTQPSLYELYLCRKAERN